MFAVVERVGLRERRGHSALLPATRWRATVTKRSGPVKTRARRSAAKPPATTELRPHRAERLDERVDGVDAVELAGMKCRVLRRAAADNGRACRVTNRSMRIGPVLLLLAGGVWEWTSSESYGDKELRGGNGGEPDRYGAVSFVGRSGPTNASNHIGFRCAKAEPATAPSKAEAMFR